MEKGKVSNEIIQDVIGKIQSEEWGEGFKLPSETALAEEYKVSRNTVREALQELIVRGYIKRIHGKGSFVLSTPINYGIDDLMSVDELIRMTGLEPSTKVARFDVGMAAESVRGLLKISKFEPVYYIERVKYANDKAVVYDSVTIPSKFLSQVSMEELNGSLFHILDSNDIHIQTAVGKVLVELASKEISEALNLSKNAPLLVLETVMYDSSNNPIMLVHDYHTDKIQFPIRRTRREL